MSVRFLNLKFLYIVIINSVFYGIVRYLDIWESLTQFAKSFLFDSCVLFALCALVANIPHKITTKALNFTLNTLFALSFVVGIVFFVKYFFGSKKAWWWQERAQSGKRA